MQSLALRWLGVFFLLVLVAIGARFYLDPGHQASETAPKESILAKVKRTHKMTCAYWLWPELIERDPNTGAMSGVFVDIINKVGEALGAEVQWTAEATIDDFIALVDSGKVDAVCGPMVPGPFLRPQANFAAPVLYAAFDVYIRPNETRFAQAREDLNDPKANILSLDGSAGHYFASTFFAQARQSTLPAVLGAGQVLLDVKNGKADVTIADQLTAGRFLDRNPGALKPLRWKGEALITLGSTPFVTKADDIVWAHTLNGIIADLLDFGVVDEILTRHKLVAGRHYEPIAKPYGLEK